VDDDDHSDLGGLLFGYLVYREIRDGRLDAGGILRAGCIVTLVVGAVLGGVLLLAVALTPRFDPGSGIQYGVPAAPAYIAPVELPPAATLRPTPEPTAVPTPKPTPLPGIGTRVVAGDGWAVTVTKVQRWRPGWYDEPGWRLITAYLKVRMPAAENECAWGDMFTLTARSGRTYQGFQDQQLREPQLFACSDYHRPTTVAGWVTFEVRDADAKGLVLTACPGDLFGCEGSGAQVKLP
jgi:hypothetical protein